MIGPSLASAILDLFMRRKTSFFGTTECWMKLDWLAWHGCVLLGFINSTPMTLVKERKNGRSMSVEFQILECLTTAMLVFHTLFVNFMLILVIYVSKNPSIQPNGLLEFLKFAGPQNIWNGENAPHN